MAGAADISESGKSATLVPMLAILAPADFFAAALEPIRAAPDVVVSSLAERRARQDADILGDEAAPHATGTRIVVAGAYSTSSLLEAELLLGSAGRLLVLYPSPEEFIAHKLAGGADGDGARAAWCEDAECLIGVAARIGRRCTLIDAELAAASPADFRFFCINRYGLAIGDIDRPSTENAPDSLEIYLARTLILENPRAKASFDELAALAFPVGNESAGTTFADAYRDLRGLKADRRDIESARRAAELLRGQLHLAQYQIESRFRRTEKQLLDLAEKQLAAAEAEKIAIAGELAAVKASPVWKLMAPMHRLASLWRQKGFGPNSHRRLADIVRRSPHFDAEWYLAQNKDIAGRNMDPALHYVRHGGTEGRSPGPNFNGTAYMAANPDLIGKGVNPLVHYVLHGEKEGRAISPRSSTAKRP